MSTSTSTVSDDAGQDAGMVIVGAGHCGGRAALVLRTLGWEGATRLAGDGAILLFYLDAEGCLVGASGFGPAGVVTKDLKIMRKLVERRARLDPALLENPAQPLKKLLSMEPA